MLYLTALFVAVSVSAEEYSESSSSEATICYGDDECRGQDICDMGSYICVTPTPSPTTPSPTEAAGCCYNGDSYKGNEKCVMASASQSKCEEKGCSWKVTDDASDCDLTTTETPPTPQPTSVPGCCRSTVSYKANGKCNSVTEEGKCERSDCEWFATDDAEDCAMTTTETPTTTVEPGCCSSDSAKKFAMCNVKADVKSCERSSSCFWKVGAEALCEPPVTTSEPGCCYGNPSAAYSARWMATCTAYSSAKECLMLADEGGVARCHWEDLSEGYDCALLWPTTTSTPTEAAGCCYGDSYKANSKCVKAMEASKCLNNGCSWRNTEDPTDCELTTESPTPKPTTAPGCCMGDSYKANGKCALAMEAGKCEEKGCSWIVTDEPSDCELTTTSSPTTTAEAGCCKGESVPSNVKCNALSASGGDKCDARSSCHWIKDGVLADGDCDFGTTEAPEEPGCCFGNPSAAYSKRWMDACTAYYTERECLMLSDDGGVARCAWQPMGEYEDCTQVWPTTTSTPTEEAGCCQGDSYKGNAKCVGIADQSGCERKSCSWLVTEEPEDCVMTTSSPTPKPTAEPGCCFGDSYKANGKCVKALEQNKCVNNGCLWLETDEPETACAMTTTESPTTTEESGCCKGDSAKSNEKCNAKEDSASCSRSSSCGWIIDGVIDIDCRFDTEAPEEPGCCFGNPDAAYSKRWMESCTAFSTERDCALLTDDEGSARCAWEPLGEYEDCSTVWPTTTATPTEAAGCCRGDSYKENDKCAKAMAQSKCEDKGCSWLITEEPKDCEMTTTESAWMGEKAPMRKASMHEKNLKKGRRQESMLFGTGGSSTGTLAEAMDYEISLSSLLLLVIAALAVHQIYRCYANRNIAGYKAVADTQSQVPAYYQTA